MARAASNVAKKRKGFSRTYWLPVAVSYTYMYILARNVLEVQ